MILPDPLTDKPGSNLSFGPLVGDSVLHSLLTCEEMIGLSSQTSKPEGQPLCHGDSVREPWASLSQQQHSMKHHSRKHLTQKGLATEEGIYHRTHTIILGPCSLSKTRLDGKDFEKP